MRSSNIYTPTIILMAVAAGICSGSNYFSQPLVHSIAIALQQDETTVAWVPALAQIAYACGLLLLMPLGDILEKRRLLFILMLLAAFGLIMSGFATKVSWLIVGTLITGVFSISAQLLLPLAASLAPVQHSGRVVGFLISALMVGILLARSLAGIMSSLLDWHIIYLISGSILLGIAVLLYKNIPQYPATRTESYFKTIASLPKIFKQNKRLRLRTSIGFLIFACMSMAFTTMSMLLAPAPYLMSDYQIGLFGLTGIIGTIIANFAGEFIDMGHMHVISIFCAVTLILSWICFGLLDYSFVFYIVATILLYSSLSAIHVTNQSIVFKLNQALKSRFNALYMTGYFTGGAVGTTAGSYAWHHFGWLGVCISGLSLASLSLIFCILDRKAAAADSGNIRLNTSSNERGT
ncbi:MFS transporter [Acinetobacter larvae]|uniref:MFS transporter n=1 Tax=Acinetobacter larvae TaxID=1789224 RepID=A0A1B2LYL7_9GAMM|nr:MFS transporter [Acinetobacter larvae]AOA58048.1 MFS transporter [Acinetobacter larvae]